MNRALFQILLFLLMSSQTLCFPMAGNAIWGTGQLPQCFSLTPAVQIGAKELKVAVASGKLPKEELLDLLDSKLKQYTKENIEELTGLLQKFQRNKGVGRIVEKILSFDTDTVYGFMADIFPRLGQEITDDELCVAVLQGFNKLSMAQCRTLEQALLKFLKRSKPKTGAYTATKTLLAKYGDINRIEEKIKNERNDLHVEAALYYAAIRLHPGAGDRLLNNLWGKWKANGIDRKGFRTGLLILINNGCPNAGKFLKKKIDAEESLSTRNQIALMMIGLPEPKANYHGYLYFARADRSILGLAYKKFLEEDQDRLKEVTAIEEFRNFCFVKAKAIHIEMNRNDDSNPGEKFYVNDPDIDDNNPFTGIGNDSMDTLSVPKKISRETSLMVKKFFKLINMFNEYWPRPLAPQPPSNSGSAATNIGRSI